MACPANAGLSSAGSLEVHRRNPVLGATMGVNQFTAISFSNMQIRGPLCVLLLDSPLWYEYGTLPLIPSRARCSSASRDSRHLFPRV